MPKPTPRFFHGCDHCKFLGTLDQGNAVTGATVEEHDLYFCSAFSPTVIARYGNAGCEYMSGLGFKLAPLVYAEELARQAGYI